MAMKPLTSIFHSTKKAAPKSGGASLHAERRTDRRVPVLSGDLPGQIRVAGTAHFIEAGAINVSVGGLCIWLAEPIVQGGVVELVMAGRSHAIPLTVVYCRPSVENQGGARWICGLRLSSLRVESLVQIFIETGCIETD